MYFIKKKIVLAIYIFIYISFQTALNLLFYNINKFSLNTGKFFAINLFLFKSLFEVL